MAKINILDKEVYNRIAAGEVVENPRSIVKELAENSIDAGAKNISIFIENGGMKLINVIDDGAGIPKNEVKKAFYPHATSKICTAEDMETIGTLGFRGEALASIASVSDIVLKTIFSGENVGTKYSLKAGTEVEFADCALEKGTSITVNSLFYNTPARFKFLKSERSEESNVTATVQNMILSNPEVAFRYSVDGVLKLLSDGQGLERAVKSIYPTVFESLMPVSAHSSDGFRLSGYISFPGFTKGNRSGQTLMINGRVVSDASLSASVQNAYGERLMTRCFPFFILDIVMPFDMVDVNVHPNKSEVRLQNPRQLYSFVYRAVKNALETLQERQIVDFKNLTNALKQDKESCAALAQNNDDLGCVIEKNEERAVSFNKTKDDESLNETLQKRQILAEKQMDFDKIYETITGKISNDIVFCSPNKDYHFLEQETELITSEKNNLLKKDGTFEGVSTEARTQFSSEIDGNSCGNVKIVGQIFQNYLIVESGEQGYIIDQHAAHERTIFDKLVVRTEAEPVLQQPLLVPFIFSGSVSECEFILSNNAILRELGFDFEEFGTNSIKVNAVPLAVSSLKFDDFFKGLLQDMSGIRSLKTSELIKNKLAQIACKSAIKAGDTLSMVQIRYFIHVFVEGGAPVCCPHGRPTVVSFDKIELEKRFKRRL